MDQLLQLVEGFEVQPVALLDIFLTALLIYGLFSLIRGTRAVRLVIGVTILYVIYVLAQTLGLSLLSQILQAGAVVGLLALVVVFQPELRRGLERIGRVGSLSWLVAPSEKRSVERVAGVIGHGAMSLGAERIGALIVVERETGLQDAAETGVMIDAQLSLELLETIFTPHSPLHDGAIIVRHERLVSAGVVLPLSDTGAYRERFGTRHRAALGITEQTDAVAVVVSEETGSVSLVERGRIVRNLDEQRLVQALIDLLQNNHLAAARIPARATVLRRRGLPLRPRVRARRAASVETAVTVQTHAVPPAHSPAPTHAPATAHASSTPAATSSGRVE
ncbi:MAG TPA: diadenylate cyclase CdaA [Candidatus Limnocylindrales bacterium]|nr:diadenylate cyclase CdaA [Candidatus Limnocylindrales bacterium]